MPVFQVGNTAHDRGSAFPWLKHLLPHRADSEILDALAHAEEDTGPQSEEGQPPPSLEARIVRVGTILGEQFLRIRAPVLDVIQEGSTLPALQLGESPRLLLKKEGSSLVVLGERHKERISIADLEGSLADFLIPAPKMTLGCLRNKAPVRRVLSYLRTERSLLKALVVYAVFVEGLSLGVPITVQVLINTISFGMMTQQLIVLSLVLLLSLSGAAALMLFQQWLVEHLSRRFFARTVMDYAERLPLLESKAMKNPVHRFFEVASVDKSFFVLGLDLVALVLQLLAATLLLAVYHPVLLGYTMVMVASAILVVRLPFRAGLNRSLEESHAKYEIADYLQGNKQNDLQQLQHFSHWQEARRASFRIAIGQQAGLFAIQVVLNVVLLFIGGALVIEGQLTLGQLVAAELVAGTALVSLGKLGKQLPKIYDLITSFEKLGTFVDLPLTTETNNDTGKVRLHTKGAAG